MYKQNISQGGLLKKGSTKVHLFTWKEMEAYLFIYLFLHEKI